MENIMLNEMSDRVRQIMYDFIHVEPKKMNTLTKIEIDSDT